MNINELQVGKTFDVKENFKAHSFAGPDTGIAQGDKVVITEFNPVTCEVYFEVYVYGDTEMKSAGGVYHTQFKKFRTKVWE